MNLEIRKYFKIINIKQSCAGLAVCMLLLWSSQNQYNFWQQYCVLKQAQTPVILQVRYKCQNHWLLYATDFIFHTFPFKFMCFMCFIHVLCRSERIVLFSEWIHWDRVRWPASRNASAPGARSAWQWRRATAFLPVLELSETSCPHLMVQPGRQHWGAVPEQDLGGERFRLTLWPLHQQ